MGLVDYDEEDEENENESDNSPLRVVEPAPKKVKIMAPKLQKLDEEKTISAFNEPEKNKSIPKSEECKLLNLLPKPSSSIKFKSPVPQIISHLQQNKTNGPTIFSNNSGTHKCGETQNIVISANKNIETLNQSYFFDGEINSLSSDKQLLQTNSIKLFVKDYTQQTDLDMNQKLENVPQFDNKLEINKFLPKHERSKFINILTPDMPVSSFQHGNLSIIEANADDIIGADKLNVKLTKNITVNNQVWDSKKAKGEINSIQKRKHQITYLAFQAKEKEFELQNQWSANRAARKEGRSKYGF